MKRVLPFVSLLLILIWATPVFALDAGEATMRAVMGRAKADKRTLVAENLKLTYNEDKAFWPIYEAYQKDLENISERLNYVINDYARQYLGKSLDDKKAEKLIKEYPEIEKDLNKHKKSVFKKLCRVIPGKKAAAYIQMENKIQAIVHFDAAVRIPLLE